MTGCRFRNDVGYEGKCNDCVEWWPLTDEFWYSRQGMRRCRACINATQTRGVRRARRNAAEAKAIRAANLRRYRRDWERRRRERIRKAELAGIPKKAPVRPRLPAVPFTPRGRGNPYASEEERIAARRETWRRSKSKRAAA